MQQMKIVTDKYNCDVLALHHLRKLGVNDNKDDPFERILGSTALAAAVDNLQILLTSGDDRVLHAKGGIFSLPKNYSNWTITGLLSSALLWVICLLMRQPKRKCCTSSRIRVK